jgi:hypothetical protein
MTNAEPELVYIFLPEPLGPIDRGDKYEDPIADELERLGLGEVTGAGTGLGEERADGSRPIESCGIDVETHDAEATRAALRGLLEKLGCPAGTHLEYESCGKIVKDEFDGTDWALEVVQGAAAQGGAKTALLEVAVSRSGPDANSFQVTAPVAAPADEVYALVDWADERNKWRQSGDTVLALDAEGRKFRLVVSSMKDLQFDYEVQEAIKSKVYACSCVPSPSIGHLVRSYEHYLFEPGGEKACVVTYTMTATFEAGLSAGQTAEVVKNMTVATHNTMAKLKANAEHGVGTAAAFSATKLMPL